MLFHETMIASSSESLRKTDFICPFICLDCVHSGSGSVSVLGLFSLYPLSPLLLLALLSFLSPLSLLHLSLLSVLSLPSSSLYILSSISLLKLWLSISMYFNLSPSVPWHVDQLYIQLVKNQNLNLKVKPHKTDFTPNQSSLAQTS